MEEKKKKSDISKFIDWTLTATIIWLTLMGADPSFVRSEKIPSAKIEQVNNKKGNVYALLINGKETDILKKIGGTDFSRDVKNVHQTLENAGVNAEQIYVLDGKPATLENLEYVIDDLSKKITKKDVLILYVTNHGDKTGRIIPVGESLMTLSDYELNETELETMLNKLHPKYSILAFTQCFSGGFAERLGNGNRIAIANSKSSRASKGGGKEPLSQYFFPALFDQLPEERKLIDKNRDNNISVEEAFDYAVNKDPLSVNWTLIGIIKNTYQLRYGIDPKIVYTPKQKIS